jgi:hypothetical protein
MDFTEIELIDKIVSYIKSKILENHISTSIRINSRILLAFVPHPIQAFTINLNNIAFYNIC